MDLRDPDLYSGTICLVACIIFELRKAEVESESAAFLRALQIYVDRVQLHAVHLYVLRRTVLACKCRP